jgi:hypothetical protein
MVAIHSFMRSGEHTSPALGESVMAFSGGLLNPETSKRLMGYISPGYTTKTRFVPACLISTVAPQYPCSLYVFRSMSAAHISVLCLSVQPYSTVPSWAHEYTLRNSTKSRCAIRSPVTKLLNSKCYRLTPQPPDHPLLSYRLARQMKIAMRRIVNIGVTSPSRP